MNRYLAINIEGKIGQPTVIRTSSFITFLQHVIDVLSVRHLSRFLWMLVYRNPSYIVYLCLMVFNPTFNNISVISWRSVLLLEETGVPGETTDLSQVTDKLYHIMLYNSHWSRFELATSVVIGTDCTSSCKSNYHTITATTAPLVYRKRW